MSKNKFSITGDKIYITRPEWSFVATATIKEDYLEEIKNVTWGLKHNRYLYNPKLGYLHSYIMKKWYGEAVCKEMKDNSYVIDHIDNVSHNCCIDNLWFLEASWNKAKGSTFDKENREKSYIALSIFKDFDTKMFQITIGFNYPATLNLSEFPHSSVIEVAYLLYEGDYRKVLLDAERILLDYKDDYSFNPINLGIVDYHIEGRVGKAYSPELYAQYLEGKHGHGVCTLTKLSPLKKWTKNTKEEYFIIKDPEHCQNYNIQIQ